MMDHLIMGMIQNRTSGRDIEKGRIMARRSKHSFIKFEKELKRKKKAKEKLERRQGKKEKVSEGDEPHDAARED